MRSSLYLHKSGIPLVLGPLLLRVPRRPDAWGALQPVGPRHPGVAVVAGPPRGPLHPLEPDQSLHALPPQRPGPALLALERNSIHLKE